MISAKTGNGVLGWFPFRELTGQLVKDWHVGGMLNVGQSNPLKMFYIRSYVKCKLSMYLNFSQAQVLYHNQIFVEFQFDLNLMIIVVWRFTLYIAKCQTIILMIVYVWYLLQSILFAMPNIICCTSASDWLREPRIATQTWMLSLLLH